MSAPYPAFLFGAVGLLRRVETEDNAEKSVFPACAGYAEMPYLGGIGNVSTDTQTFVVVADMHYADGLRGVVGQAVEVETLLHLILCGKLLGDGQMSVYDLIDTRLYGGNLLGSKRSGKLIVALALLTLDMCAYGALATYEFYHSAVEDMLCRMHRGYRQILKFLTCSINFHSDSKVTKKFFLVKRSISG